MKLDWVGVRADRLETIGLMDGLLGIIRKVAAMLASLYGFQQMGQGSHVGKSVVYARLLRILMLQH